MKLVTKKKRPKRGGKALTPAQAAAGMKRFLAQLAQGHSVTLSAKAAGISRTMLYEWRDADPAFARAWEQAYQAGGDHLEDFLMRISTEGWERPIFQGGVKVGTERQYAPLVSFKMLEHRRNQPRRELEERAMSNVADMTERQLEAVREQSISRAMHLLTFLHPAAALPAPKVTADE